MLEKITGPDAVRRWEGDFPVGHRYTPGVAGEAFFTALRDRGVLLGSRCGSCGYTYVPARLLLRAVLRRAVGGHGGRPEGALISFTIVFEGVDGEPLDAPETLGLVRLDGADAVLLHRVVDQGDEPLEVGERVEVALRPQAERTGSILDIEGFRAVLGLDDRLPRCRPARVVPVVSRRCPSRSCSRRTSRRRRPARRRPPRRRGRSAAT